MYRRTLLKTIPATAFTGTAAASHNSSETSGNGSNSTGEQTMVQYEEIADLEIDDNCQSFSIEFAVHPRTAYWVRWAYDSNQSGDGPEIQEHTVEPGTTEFSESVETGLRFVEVRETDSEGQLVAFSRCQRHLVFNPAVTLKDQCRTTVVTPYSSQKERSSSKDAKYTVAIEYSDGHAYSETLTGVFRLRAPENHFIRRVVVKQRGAVVKTVTCKPGRYDPGETGDHQHGDQQQQDIGHGNETSQNHRNESSNSSKSKLEVKHSGSAGPVNYQIKVGEVEKTGGGNYTEHGDSTLIEGRLFIDETDTHFISGLIDCRFDKLDEISLELDGEPIDLEDS